MELLREHTHSLSLTHTHTHTHTHTFQAWVSLVSVFMSAFMRPGGENLPVSLHSLVASVGFYPEQRAQRGSERERVTTVTVHCFMYGQLVCVCVCERERERERGHPVTFDVKTHSTCCSHFWSHPSYQADIAGQPPWGRWHRDLCVCVCVCVRVCVCVFNIARKRLTRRSPALDRLNFSTINLLQPGRPEWI